MAKTRVKKVKEEIVEKDNGRFHFEFLNPLQKLAFAAFSLNPILFLTGVAGSGKTFLSMAFSITHLLQGRNGGDNNIRKIVLTRPMIGGGEEELGWLPGSVHEKTCNFYVGAMDCISKLVGDYGPQREIVDRSLEIIPISFLRSRTLDRSIIILEEAQNATYNQIKLVLTRLGKNSKVIINGDLSQSDIPKDRQCLEKVINKLQDLEGVATVKFGNEHIVRHSLISKILERLD